MDGGTNAARAALVTGGSSGIGLAIARALSEDGYGVTIAARKPTKLERAAEQLRTAGGEVEAVRADVASEREVVELARRHRERFGRLDVLVNSAGIGQGAPIEKQATARLDVQLDVNLRAVILTIRECLPMLLAAGAEHRKALVVNLSSLAGKTAGPSIAAYSATKAAVVGLTQALHREHARDGIQATALCPGFVDTAMTSWIRKAVPRDEMIQPDDVAAAVRYLLSTSPTCFVPELQLIRASDAPA